MNKTFVREFLVDSQGKSYLLFSGNPEYLLEWFFTCLVGPSALENCLVGACEKLAAARQVVTVYLVRDRLGRIDDNFDLLS